MTVELTHIRITEAPTPPGRKTLLWNVHNKYDGGYLGFIEWFGRWRKYAFSPAYGCVFEEVCMRELSDFIVARTKEHKAVSAKARTA